MTQKCSAITMVTIPIARTLRSARRGLASPANSARLFSIICCIAIALSPELWAKGADPSQEGSAYNEKGYSKDSVYVNVDGPEINAFNFNFMFDLPLSIGLNYPENADISLQLKLSYNSQVWRWENAPVHRKFMRVRRQNPFGLGFDVTFGRIIAHSAAGSSSPYAYVDSSGAQHALYQLTAGSLEYRSHDGSHIRAVIASDSSTWTVSFSNGLVQELGNHITGPVLDDLTDQGTPCNPDDPPDSDPCPERVFVPDALLGSGFDRDYVGWHVKSVYTRASTNGPALPSYTIEYYGEDGQNTSFRYVIKRITDQFGRQILFHLDATRGVVDSITTPAPASEGGGSRTATYLLDIQTKALTMLGQSWSAPVLKSISGPEVATAQRYVHSFDYWTSVGSGGGQLLSITYPSGRLVKVGYHYYSFLNGGQGYCNGVGTTRGDEDECNQSTNGGTCAHTWGVGQIEKFLDGNPNNTQPANYKTTTFTQTQVANDYHPTGWGCSDPGSPGTSGYWRYDQLHTMIDSAGNKTEFRYRTPKEQEDEKLHGLLVSETYYGGGGTGTVLQKKKEIDYAPIPGCLTQDWRVCRWCMPCSDYATLDDSGDYHASFEMVPTRTVTTWWDDEDESGGAFTTPTRQIEDHTDFDGFGHYQRAELMGSAIGEPHKLLIKDYASDNLGPGGLCATAIALKANWLGDVVAREEVHEHVVSTDNLVSRTDYGYDTSRGLRSSEMQRLNGAVALDTCTNAPLSYSGDKVIEYGFTTAGDLQTIRHYIPGLSSSDGPTDVTARFTYSYGARDSGKNDALSYHNFFRVIDHDSGLPIVQRDHPTSSTDSSAVATTFAYDVLGRTTKITHGTDAPLIIAYENEPSTVMPSPAVTLSRVRSTQGTGIAQTESVDHFKYARLERGEKLNPDGSRAYRYVQYDDKLDRISFESEWTRQTAAAGVPGTTTDYRVFDSNESFRFQEPFGRPTKITDALGKVTTLRYFGLNKETTIKGVALKATAMDDPADVRSRHYTDALGRLRVVSKPTVISSGTGHGPYEETGAGAEYTYDVLGRITQAEISGFLSFNPNPIDRYGAVASSPQIRTWEYDSLGRLTTTNSPESGEITNLAWNALGQVTETQDALGLAWGHKHRTTYDGAGRPIRIQRVIPSGGTTINLAYGAGDGTWNTHGGKWRYDSFNTCLQPPRSTWYIGTPSCQYGIGAATGALELDSPTISVPHGSILTFTYFREVRDEVGAAGNHDRFSVKIEDQAAAGIWTEVYLLDSSQVSWTKWVQSPAISLDPWAGKNVKIRFEFDSVTPNGDNSLRGIGISQVTVRRPSTVTLQETSYDESFSLSGNKPRGKPTTIKDYDEATGGAIFTRELHYVDANARLSDEILSFDWDRDGSKHILLDSYNYDSRGDLSGQVMPHLQGVSARHYDYWRWHGAVIGISATDQATNVAQTVLPGDLADGIQYNDAGGMSVVRFANGLEQHIEPNAEFLANRIWVDRGAGSEKLWDTGQYLYDGARNIKQIGPGDYYRYDAAMRLTWARETSSTYNTVDLDQFYDAFGNMTAQNAARSGGGTNPLPDGSTFSGRTYLNNRISNASFIYDANGNLIAEPVHDNLSAQRYSFTPENQLARITPGASESLPGASGQAALYEGDHRWFRSTWADGSKALITLRDASGQVVADFLESNATSGLELQREYVRANGQLVAINSACGPRPGLTSSGTASGQVWFDRMDFGVTAVGSYTVYIRTDSGQTKIISLPSSTPSHFSIAQAQFFPDVMNWVQIETDAACGHTGYSNAVSYAYYTPAPPPTGGGGCLGSIAATRYGFNGSGSHVKVLAIGDDCPSGTTYNIYYVDPNAEATALTPLNGSTPVSNPLQVLLNMPCGSGEGNYWVRRVSPVTHLNTGSPSPVVFMDGSSCGGGSGSGAPLAPGGTSMNVQFVHWDHLGSTRMMTDEHGMTLAAFKYYPFGMEAESSGGDELRQKFTGHERDDRVGLDYMMARSCRMSLGRFIEPDPYEGSVDPYDPQSWNRYAYVSNNPINATDPSGYAGALVTALCATNGSCDRPGGPGDGDPVGGSLRERGQQDNAVSTAVPKEVKPYVKASIAASNAPSEVAGDKTGGFHEEGGYWGRDASGGVVVVPAAPGKAADPSLHDEGATIDVMKAADPTRAAKVAVVDGTWHVHPSGVTWVGRLRYKFDQRPRQRDYNLAKAGVNFVVGARWREVTFFNRAGKVGDHISLRAFMKE